MTTKTTAELLPEDYDECITCGGARGGADRFFCEVCLDQGAPEELLKDSPFCRGDDLEELGLRLTIALAR